MNETNLPNEGKNKKTIIIIITIVLLIIISLCIYLFIIRDDEEPKKENQDTEVYQASSEYQMSGNSLENFDLAFLQLENTNVNKIYSPLSIKYALQMLSTGASNNTKSQIDSIIGSYETKKYTNSANMSFANAIFIKDSYKSNIKTDYINTLTNTYNADVIYDSFESPNKLNTWVSDKTFNLINNLVSDIQNLDYVLVNALAIDMEWVNKIQQEHIFYDVDYKHEDYFLAVPSLDASNYSSLDFNSTYQAKAAEIAASVNKYDIVDTIGEENIRQTVGEAYSKWLAEDPCYSANEALSVDTYLDKYITEIDSNYQHISSSTDFYFYDDASTKAFAKDLKQYNGTTLQYVSIMPKNESLSDYLKDVDNTKINNIINNLKDISLDNFEEGYITKITGFIPMFEFDYELDLTKDLKTLGITDVFDPKKANLNNLTSDDNAFIDYAIHKANISFSNDGIKAAAATLVGGYGDISCEFRYDYEVPIKEIDLTFDNPYLFLIRDKESGEVWFIGTVYEPIDYNTYMEEYEDFEKDAYSNY